MGDCCYPALFLKAGLRHMALPFDWLFSNTEMTAHCINDDFRDFQNVEHLQPCLPPELWAEAVDTAGCIGALVSGHEIYSAMTGSNIIFKHHNLNFPTDRAYFARACRRMSTILSEKNARKLFLVFSRHGVPRPTAG